MYLERSCVVHDTLRLELFVQVHLDVTNIHGISVTIGNANTSFGKINRGWELFHDPRIRRIVANSHLPRAEQSIKEPTAKKKKKKTRGEETTES